MKFVKINDVELIPRHLIEQVEDQLDSKRFYTTMAHMVNSPTHFIYVMLDDYNEIRGYLWYEVNILDYVFFVNTLSIDKNLWGKKTALRLAVEHIKKEMRTLQIPKAFIMTDRPAFFEKIGCVKSKNYLLEYHLK